MGKWFIFAAIVALGYAVRAVWRPPRPSEEEDPYEEPRGDC